MKLFIGNKTYSSWSLRGWLACRQSGLAFEETVVSLYDDSWAARRKAPEFAPSGGRVPILWDGDTAVWDSLAILDWLDAKTGGTRFWPRDPAALALARSMCAEMHSGYTALRQHHSMNLRRVYAAQPLRDDVTADVARIEALWARARHEFGSGGDFLFGDFGAADILFAPVATRFVTYSIALGPLAQRYVDAIMAHPFLVEWTTAAATELWVIDHFEGAMQG
jgi:glutathione S-transferase